MDVAVFTQAMEEQCWEEALACSAGPLLAGQQGYGTREFTAWLDGDCGRLPAALGCSHRMSGGSLVHRPGSAAADFSAVRVWGD